MATRVRGTMKENPPPGMMISLDGSTKIAEPGHAVCAHCGGCPIVKRNGVPIGVYIDDTTPNRRQWVVTALEHHLSPQIVFIGIGPDERRGTGIWSTLDDANIGIPKGIPSSRLLWLHEWIGWGNADGSNEPLIPWREFLPVRDCHAGNGYIQQWGWHGPYGHAPPNKTCREIVGRQMRKHKPRFTFKLM